MIYGNKFNNAFAEEAMVDPIEFMAVDLMEMSMFEHVSESALDDIETDSLNESYIIEYTGNETRNEEYRECLKKLDELIQLYIKRIKSVQAIFDKMVALYMTINKKNIFKVESEIRQTGRNGNKSIDAVSKDIHEKAGRTWREFTKLSNKFCVKYSTVTMDEKEKFTKKIEPYYDTLEKILDKYTDSKFKEKLVKKEEDEVLAAAEYNGKDYKYGQEILNTIGSWYSYMINEISYTMSDIRFIYKKMGSKDSPIYKLINKDYVSKLKAIKLKER